MHGPTPAERARTALHQACAITLRVAGISAWLDVYGTDAAGAPLLVVPAAAPLLATLRASSTDLPAVIEVVDVHPLPVPDPVRARLWLAGWLTEVPAAERRAAVLAVADRRPSAELLDVGSGRTVLRLELGQVLFGPGDAVVLNPDNAVDVDLDAYAAAAPDVLADEEAMHLAHLVQAHARDLALLCRLLDAEARQGRVIPACLDRYGLGLCVQTSSGWCERRLTFPHPLVDPRQLPAAMQALLHQAVLHGAPDAR